MLPAARATFLSLFIALFMVTWSNDTGLRAAVPAASGNPVDHYVPGIRGEASLSKLTLRPELRSQAGFCNPR